MNFKEFKGNKNGFSGVTLCHCLTDYVKNYIKESKINIDSKERDAILVIFINYLGYQGAIDLALYAKDLYKEKTYGDKIEPNKLITNLLNHGSYFLYNNDIAKTIQENSHMHEFKGKINKYNVARVVVDFINYIAKVNYIERRFSIKELRDRYEKYESKTKLKTLKKFLKNSSTYSELFVNGETLENLYRYFIEYKEIISELYLEKCGQLYFDIVGKKEIDEELDDELYELAYAYVKSGIQSPDEPKIIQKLKLEMSQK